MDQKNCVALNLSSEGTCVIQTNCDGVDLESFEFAFDCAMANDKVQRHSFGFGGFDAQEEFDTSVKCTTCNPPQSQHHVLVGTGSSDSNLDQSVDESSFVNKVESLTSEVGKLNETLSTLRSSVKKLKGEVLKAPAPAALAKISSSTREKKVAEQKKPIKLHLKTSRKRIVEDDDQNRDQDQDQDQDKNQGRNQDEDQDDEQDDS